MRNEVHLSIERIFRVHLANYCLSYLKMIPPIICIYCGFVIIAQRHGRPPKTIRRIIQEEYTTANSFEERVFTILSLFFYRRGVVVAHHLNRAALI